MNELVERGNVREIEELINIEREVFGLPLGPFHRDWLLRNRAPERVRRHIELARKHPHLMGINQSFTGGELGFAGVNTAAFGARNTSLAELNILQDGSTGASSNTSQAVINQYCAIPPADVFAGQVFEVLAIGQYGNTSTPTMIFTPRWGSSATPATNVTLGANSAWTSITGTTGLPYLIQFLFWVYTSPPGATQATGKGRGGVTLGIPVTSSQVAADILIGGTAATIDASGQGTAGCGLTIGLTWSASSASNTSTCEGWKLSSR